MALYTRQSAENDIAIQMVFNGFAFLFRVVTWKDKNDDLPSYEGSHSQGCSLTIRDH
jgi:hypothetical protein